VTLPQFPGSVSFIGFAQCGEIRWMADTYSTEPPKSALAKACQYTINRWQALRRILEDGLCLANTPSAWNH
jgi:hypothetical protein